MASLTGLPLDRNLGRGLPSSVLPILLMVLAALALAGFPASLRFQSLAVARPLNWTESVGFLMLGAALVIGSIYLGSRVLRPATALFERLGTRLWTPLLIGLALRLIVVLVLRPTPSSDGATYLSLALKLAQGEAYSTGSTVAYWPPGLSLALAPIVRVFGAGSTGLLIYGLACFVVAGLGAWQLARRAGLAEWSAVPVWLLALWPTHVLCTGLPEKELLVIALMPWALAFAVDALSGPLRWALAAGMVLGAMVLVQPSMQLLPLAGLVVMLLLLEQRLRSLAVFALLMVAMLATIAPWTYRNYLVLGEPVLVSTNGGSNLYRANNELATGAYTEQGRVSLDGMGELDANREGRRLAVEWITEHPLQFARLSLSKMLNFSGDDSYGAFAALKRGSTGVPTVLYQVVKLLAAAPWLLIWVLMAAVAQRHLREHRRVPASTVPLLLPYAYLFALHAIFESAGKYHLPALVPTLVLAVMLIRADAAVEPKGGPA